MFKCLPVNINNLNRNNYIIENKYIKYKIV